VQTGSYDNVIVIRKAAESEVQSGIERLKASIVETQPEIAIGPDGKKFVAKELVVLIALPKRVTGNPSNVVIRGVEEHSMTLRPQVKLVRGRLPKPGSSEIIAGLSIAKRFRGGDMGESLRFAMRDWSVVGVFDAGNTSFNSEIWGDVHQFMQAFRRPVFSSIIFRLRNSAEFDKVRSYIETDPRLTLDAFREPRYYKKQSEIMAKFLRILGLALTTIFSLGAIIGAMITLYSSVANRIFEIGTLRALGFQRWTILLAFLMESLFLGFFGGITGLLIASFLQLYTISTMNWQTFSELAFSFTLTYKIIFFAMLFSLAMGLIGGILPALRASRMNIVDSLRAG
jgi:ABC-type antimicrobial peptide transport system permease subunit